VFTAAEDQVATVMAEMEVQERTQPQPLRRDRRMERPRWRERRDRGEIPRPAVQQPPQPAETTEERWALNAETERQLESAFAYAGNQAVSSLPRPLPHPPPPVEVPVARVEADQPESVPETHTDISLPPDSASTDSGSSDAEGTTLRLAGPEASPDVAPLDAASIKDNDDVAPFSADSEARSGFNARRRGPGARRKRYTAARHTHHAEHKTIDDMLREGQEILVQVAKEPIGKKGARVTSHIALPGRYLVYMPTVEHVGVSRKIDSETERIRLKDIILKHRDRFPGGIIVRTAAEEHTEEDLVNDLNFLVKLWEDIRSRSEKISAPALVHSELNLVQRLLRDQFSFEFASIRVDDEIEYQRMLEFVDKIYPNLVHRVKLYTKDAYIFDEYGITQEIDRLLQPKIWLKSGGYIVINQTEALVSIDINTGKFVGKGNSLEETITRTNLEAVKEIVKQIRLRDLGGIIVIDFIDMDERKNRKRVMEALSQEIARDKAPNKILEFNEFGLVAITRKRVKQSLERTLCQPCQYCSGSGLVKSVATTCYSIYHEVERMRNLVDGRSEVMIRVHPDVARALRESESAVVEELRHLLKKDVVIKADSTLHIEHYNIVT
ncbi:MAG TPA: Rne/Rng family ribonuclease, partial [Acidobacteriota bacterium]|nr:Rne/Rng family ribonuclease [Acidobacteriota bacterium]